MVGRPPRADSIQPAALGTAIDSTGVGQGFFAGSLDEARIWNYARTPEQIAAGYTREIAASPGLLGRWGFNDGFGRVFDSTAQVPAGLLAGNSWSWVTSDNAALSNVPNAAPAVDAGAIRRSTFRHPRRSPVSSMTTGSTPARRSRSSGARRADPASSRSAMQHRQPRPRRSPRSAPTC